MGNIVKCPHCGKEFIKNSSSIYKHKKDGHIVYYCSYKCWAADDTRKYNYAKGEYTK